MNEHIKWKDGITAEHAALCAFGYCDYTTLENAQKGIIQFPKSALEPHSPRRRKKALQEHRPTLKELKEIEQVSNALKEAILAAHSANMTQRTNTSGIEIYQEVFLAKPIDKLGRRIDEERTLIQKASLAEWFSRKSLHEAAVLFDPSLPPPPSRSRCSNEALLEAIGILAMIISKQTPSLTMNSKPNASQISQKVERFAGQVGVELKATSNLQRDIKAGVNLIYTKLEDLS